jgi:isoleucyl-tRNA synthetase
VAGKSDEKLERKFEIVKGVIEGILSTREEIKMGIRWPLKSAKIYLHVEEDVADTFEVIKRQCNVKEIDSEYVKESVDDIGKVGKFNEGYVTVDSALTPELQLEGFTREVIRRVQMERKKLRLVKDDRIELFVEGDFDVSANKLEIEKKVGELRKMLGFF